jgi:hypothetical protein
MFNRTLTAVPAQRSSAALLRVKVAALIGFASVASLSGIASTIAWTAFSPDIPQVEDLLPVGSAYAQTVAGDFLAGRPTFVPTATDIDATFGTADFAIDPATRKPIPVRSVAPLKVSRETLTTPEGVQVYELHSYLVSTPTELRQLDILLLLTQERPVLAAQPSLLPLDPVEGTYEPVDYRQFSNARTTTSPTTNEQIRAWANAFARNDAAALRQVTGDNVTTGSYVGLGGYRVADSPLVINAVTAGGPDRLVVRVRLLLAADGTDGAVASADYDLLVIDATTELPKIAAWSAPGAPKLEPFMNNPTTQPPPAETP